MSKSTALIRFKSRLNQWLNLTEYEETEPEEGCCPGRDGIPILLQHRCCYGENLGLVSKLESKELPPSLLCPPRKRWSDRARHSWRNTPRHGECWPSPLWSSAKGRGTRRTRWSTRSSWSWGWCTQHRRSPDQWRISSLRASQLPGIITITSSHELD